jgi:hypothetical protein
VMDSRRGTTYRACLKMPRRCVRWSWQRLLNATRMQFGAKSERLPEEQMQLGLEALEQAIAKAGAEAEKRGPELRKNNARRRASRGALPAHLPRIEVTLVPDDTGCPCRRTPVTVIGEDSSERLNVIPAPYRVIVTKRAGVQSKPQLAAKRAGSGLLQNLLHEHSIGAADHLKRRSAWLWPQLPRAAANVSAFTGAPSHGVASHC